ncbi:hypothetical protein D3C77_526370 [compost metagenome]
MRSFGRFIETRCFLHYRVAKPIDHGTGRRGLDSHRQACLHQVSTCDLLQSRYLADRPGQRAALGPAIPIECACLVNGRAEQVIEGGQTDTVMVDQKAQVLEVCVRVADQYVEDQPLEKLRTGDRGCGTQIGQSCQLLDAAGAVLVGSIQTEQLAGVDAVQATPVLAIVAPVKALYQVHRLRNVAARNGGYVQLCPRRQGHHEPFVYHRVGVRQVGMIGF